MQRFARGKQIFRGLFFFGDVARDFCVAQQCSGFAAYGVNDHAGPELRAVFAYPPSFRLESSFGGGGGQRFFGKARGAILFGIEARKMLADDLVRLVALEAFGAGVRSEEHTSELQSLMRHSYAVFCLTQTTYN